MFLTGNMRHSFRLLLNKESTKKVDATIPIDSVQENFGNFLIFGDDAVGMRAAKIEWWVSFGSLVPKARNRAKMWETFTFHVDVYGQWQQRHHPQFQQCRSMNYTHGGMIWPL